MTKEEQKKKKNVHEGHRKRMREDYELKGFEDKPEHIVLEYMLNMVLPRVNTNVIAHDILEECGGFANAFRANKEQLLNIDGVGNKVAEYLNMLGEFVHYYNRKRFDVNGKFLNSETCEQYLLDVFDGKEKEYFYMICLDAKCRIITKIELSQGSFESLNIDVRRIVRCALKYDTTYVVLAHNHPSGILKASNADIVSTQSIARILQICDIKLYDHIIVAGGKCMSMRSEGFLDPKQMHRQK